MTTDRKYVLWRRVSTKQQGDSHLGLDAQQTIAEYFMHSVPEKVFTDVYSGTKLAECPNLQKAIRYCKQYNYLLVIAKTDRFRNVQEALAILDELGEGNLCFCDLPTTDRTVLTIVFAIWERQAMMGRINTKRALEERKKQLQKHEQFISKSGRVCTHLGARKITAEERAAGVKGDNSAAVQAQIDQAIAWRENSMAVKFALRKRAEGWTLQRIVDELGQLYDDNMPSGPDTPNPYGTPKGCKPQCGTVSRWLSEANPLTMAM
ncbi:MAG: recombinase family protein [Muribaculaceae bacterium]|nr:recombinase family protein [Muribaculaceae bacterium]